MNETVMILLSSIFSINSNETIVMELGPNETYMYILTNSFSDNPIHLFSINITFLTRNNVVITLESEKK